MTRETNIQTLSKNGVSVNTDESEIKKLIGMHICMGNNSSFPRVRLYWAPKCKIPLNCKNNACEQIFQIAKCSEFKQH